MENTIIEVLGKNLLKKFLARRLATISSLTKREIQQFEMKAKPTIRKRKANVKERDEERNQNSQWVSIVNGRCVDYKRGLCALSERATYGKVMKMIR